MNIPTYLSGLLQVKAYRVLQMMAQEVLQHFDLKPTQWSIMGQLYANKAGLRAADVAEALGVEGALVTMMVQELVKRDLIAKTAHINDGRARMLKLTLKGRAVVDHIERVLNANLKQLLHGVTSDDLLAYQRVLETIIANSHTSELRVAKLIQRQRRISSVVLLDNLDQF